MQTVCLLSFSVQIQIDFFRVALFKHSNEVWIDLIAPYILWEYMWSDFLSFLLHVSQSFFCSVSNSAKGANSPLP